MTQRERYLAALRGGKKKRTIAEVAKMFGVSRQAVSQAVHPERTRQRARVAEAAARRAVGASPRRCRNCDELGHNAQTCKGKGKRCKACRAVNPARQWKDGACPRCGVTP